MGENRQIKRSRSEGGSVSYLGAWNGRPKVGANLIDNPNQNLGALSRGKVSK